MNEVTNMLKKFEVENFKGFQNKLTFDLNAREYSFNSEIIQNGIVNKAIIYGKNGVGKSNLGIALFDIVSHLTDKQPFNPKYTANYRNYNAKSQVAYFRYEFLFEKDIVIYEYTKRDYEFLISEKLQTNDKVIIDFEYFGNKKFVDKKVAGELNIDLPDNKLSIIKYLYRNMPTNSIPLISKMVEFCEKMLWYRSLSEGNTYSGFTNGISSLTERIYEKNKLEEFTQFLHENGLDFDLEFETNNGMHELFAKYKYGKAPFSLIASTGTMALLLYFYWSISSFEDISLLFIDEFDAFFHYESAENIVLKLNSATSFQSILTSHNTYLMQNKLTRPDCCFIMSENKVTSLYEATEKEIREAHNLEKMYINGVFKE